MITAFYSFRLISLTFLSYPNAPKKDYEHTHEQPLIVVLPYVILSVLAIFFGYLAKDLFIGPGSDFLSTALFVHPKHIVLVEAEFSLPLFYKLLPAIGSFRGAVVALILYNMPSFTFPIEKRESSNSLSMFNRELYRFFNGKYFFDVIYNHYLINRALETGLITSKVLDRGLVEKIGPFGFTDTFYKTSHQIASLDTGVVTSYALYIILGLISLTLFLFTPVFTGFVTDIRIVLVFSIRL